MRRIAILLTLVVLLVGFVFVIGCESNSTSAKATGEQEVIQASAYSEDADAMNVCDKDKTGCSKEASCSKASSCPMEASSCSK